MAHIVTHTSLGKVNEAVLQLGNESLVMPVDFSSNLGFRLGLRYSIPGMRNLRDVEWLFGAFKDIRYPWRSNQCVEWLGVTLATGNTTGVGTAQLVWTKGSGANFNYFTSNFGRSFSKVGSLVAPVTGPAGTACTYINSWPVPVTTCMIIDFARTAATATTTTWNFYCTTYNSGTMSLSCTQQQFLQNMEINYGGSFVAGLTGPFTWTGHVHPGPGQFDAVELSWNQAANPLEIYDVAVTMLQ